MVVMRSSRRLRALVVGATALMLLLIQLFAVVMSGVDARNDTIRVGREAISRVGDTTIESILRQLTPAEQSAKTTARLIGDDLLTTSDPALERYLFAQLAVMPQVTGAFVGYPDGAFVFVSREDGGFHSKRITIGSDRTVLVRHYDGDFVERSSERPTDDTYDPRTRPWYSLAVNSEEAVWTAPYVFFSSAQPGVTTAKAVRRDSGSSTDVFAVAGVDVELSGLSAFLDDLPIAKSGEAFVVSGDSVVAAPSSFAEQTTVEPDGSLRLLTTDELGIPGTARKADSGVQAVEGEHGTELVLHRSLPAGQGPPWDVVVRAPESGFTDAVRQQQRSVLLISIGGGALLLGASLLMLRLTRPLVTLHDMASTDPLTGLANRRRVGDEGGQMLASALSDGASISVLVIDLDDFKALNDSAGHHVGDQALRVVGRALRAAVRERDLVGRLGGDEFVVVQRVNGLDEAVAGADRTIVAVKDSLRSLGDPASAVGASGGLTISLGEECDFDLLLRQADSALIGVKAADKGTVRLAAHLVSGTPTPPQ